MELEHRDAAQGNLILIRSGTANPCTECNSVFTDTEGTHLDFHVLNDGNDGLKSGGVQLALPVIRHDLPALPGAEGALNAERDFLLTATGAAAPAEANSELCHRTSLLSHLELTAELWREAERSRAERKLWARRISLLKLRTRLRCGEAVRGQRRGEEGGSGERGVEGLEPKAGEGDRAPSCRAS